MNRRTAFASLALWSLVAFCSAAAPLPRETFEVGGHRAFIIAAPDPAKGKPWLWYAHAKIRLAFLVALLPVIRNFVRLSE